MSATTASATSRRTLRGSVIGLGLLLSVGVLAPPAHAAPTAANDAPPVADFQLSGPLKVELVAHAPDDLDLSGARFDVLGAGGAVVGSCDTDAFGVCEIPMAQYSGTSTVFSLVQEAGQPVPGLVPTSAVRTFTLRSPDATDCPTAPVPVLDASLFRTGLAVTVQDAGTTTPLSGAEYSVTGPDYRHRPATPQDAGTTVFPDPTLSGRDGLLTYHGWFLPGDYSLTPEVTPHGYRSSGVLPVTLPAPTSDAGDAWATTVGLAADVPDVIGIGRPAVPPVAPRTPPAGPASSAPRPVVAPPVVAPPVAAVLPPAPASPFVASTPPAAPSAEPSASDSALPPPAAERAPMADPQLRVSSATSLLDIGLVGLAAVLVALVVFGVGYVRRKARH